MGRNPIRVKLVLNAEARSKLESIGKSRTEGKARIMRYLQDLNADPGVFRWRYKVEEASISWAYLFFYQLLSVRHDRRFRPGRLYRENLR